MSKLHLPHVILPLEFVSLLKESLPTVTSPDQIFSSIRPNEALYTVLGRAFKEFDDGRGLEKTMIALGWPSFRERMASIFVSKSIHGIYPNKTSLDDVEDIIQLENRFSDQSVHGYSRVFLLGFYLRLANIQIQRRENNRFKEILIPKEVELILNLSQGRTEKIDWLILITLHLIDSLGAQMLTNYLLSGKKFNDLYGLMQADQRKNMMDNLLAYGLSISEPDNFLYEKV